MGVGMKVSRLIQQKTHSEIGKRKMLQETGLRVEWVGFFVIFFFCLISLIQNRTKKEVSFPVLFYEEEVQQNDIP